MPNLLNHLSKSPASCRLVGMWSRSVWRSATALNPRSKSSSPSRRAQPLNSLWWTGC